MFFHKIVLFQLLLSLVNANVIYSSTVGGYGRRTGRHADVLNNIASQDSWSRSTLGGLNNQNQINNFGSDGYISSVSEYNNIIGSALGEIEIGNLNLNNDYITSNQPDHGFTNNIETGMPYDFSYNVNENGNNYGHSEMSDGNIVKGRYFVQLPDGRLQTVNFRADPNSGYSADVQYESIAKQSSNNGYSLGVGNGGSSIDQLPLAFNSLQNDYGANSLTPYF